VPFLWNFDDYLVEIILSYDETAKNVM